MVHKVSTGGSHFSGRSFSLLLPTPNDQRGSKEEVALGWWSIQPLTLAVGRGKAAGAGKTPTCQVITSFLLAALGVREWKETWKQWPLGNKSTFLTRGQIIEHQQLIISKLARLPEGKPGGWRCSLGSRAPTMCQALWPYYVKVGKGLQEQGHIHDFCSVLLEPLMFW